MNKQRNKVTIKPNTLIKSTLQLVVWLLAFILSAIIVYYNNVGTNEIGKVNNVIAEGTNTFDTPDESTRVGNGSESAPYQISTLTDLQKMAELVNNGSTNSNNKAYNEAYYKLMADISDESSPLTTWTPIGNSSSNQFKGTFDGQGHKITFNDEVTISTNYAGLFGYVYNGTIQNLGVHWNSLTGTSTSILSYVGGIAGYNRSGTISNCYNTGSVTGTGSNSYVGGIAGENDEGIIINCYNTGSVTSSVTNIGTYLYVGGIAGLNSGTISNSYNTGSVTSSVTGIGSYLYVGGIAGGNSEGTISNCYNTGSVTGTSSGTDVGGIAGDNSSGTISNCFVAYSGTAITIQGYTVGGVVGNSGGTVTNCYYDSGITITGTQSDPIVGTAESGLSAKLQSTNNNIPDHTVLKSWDFRRIWTYPSDEGFPTLRTGMEYIFSGEGTESKPYKINNEKDLDGLSRNIYSGYTKYNSANYIVTAPIDATSLSNTWIPIGDYTTDTRIFSGVFDGGGYEITFGDVVVTTDYAGLFGYNNGTIKNLGIHWNSLTGTGTDTGSESFVGGIAGRNDGTISNSYNTGSVEGSSSMVGGIVGGNIGTISNCYNTGSVTGTGSFSAVGGIAGLNFGTISNSYNTGSVTGSVEGSSSMVGGIVGVNVVTISNCYNTGSVKGTDSSSTVGGIAGMNEGTISNCYNTGSVTGTGSSSMVGGIVGGNAGIISNCFVAYSGTAITIQGNTVGGVVCNNDSNATVTNCYYDSGIQFKNASGGSATSVIITGVIVVDNLNNIVTDANQFLGGDKWTTAEVENPWDTTEEYKWDFETVWTFQGSKTGFPVLKAFAKNITVEFTINNTTDNNLLVIFKYGDKICAFNVIGSRTFSFVADVNCQISIIGKNSSHTLLVNSATQTTDNNVYTFTLQVGNNNIVLEINK